jgi:hypothetical protein
LSILFSLGLVILEAATNVVLPDNGTPWRKLREDDFSDVDLGHISDELVNVIVHLLSSDPVSRTTIEELQQHPVLSKMQALRRAGMAIERTGADDAMLQDVTLSAKGAVIEEEPDFLPKLFAEVRNAWHSPRHNRIAPISTSNNMDIDEQ